MKRSRKDVKQFVQCEKNRHGTPVYYFRRGKTEPRIRLVGVPGTKEFDASYWEAFETGKMTPRLISRQRSARQKMELTMRRRLISAKNRASEKGREFDLDFDWLMERITAQGFKCDLTGIPFFSESDNQASRDPFAPSIDRIDCSKGYTKGNVRIIIYALNVMLNDWGEGVFYRVALAYKNNRSRTSYLRTEIKNPAPENNMAENQ
jgi:hypothetical protein